MLKDKIVRVRLRKFFNEQKPTSYVGKCVVFTNDWIVIEGFGIMLTRASKNGAQIDARPSQTAIPSSNIESIRVLPDDFAYGRLQLSTEGQQLVIVVPNAQPCVIGEIGEG
ncbi:MAG TPA: hypothetical protein PKZ59_07040 [Candidatus Hydrogenedentes bacterium]|jgi:hypothetical protein|nr:MAG: hypothetical protein BWY07_02086 [Candidatus Hydrogenedentes bacterium ADurb.Bin170]HPX86426.1 hypothetical protein [Candidatus Hydrogenedentota bacterium]